MLRLSTLAVSTLTSALKVLSTILPDVTFLSLVRTTAPPLPGLWCWNHTTDHSCPSRLSTMPFLRSFVVAIGEVLPCSSAYGRGDAGHSSHAGNNGTATGLTRQSNRRAPTSQHRRMDHHVQSRDYRDGRDAVRSVPAGDGPSRDHLDRAAGARTTVHARACPEARQHRGPPNWKPVRRGQRRRT